MTVELDAIASRFVQWWTHAEEHPDFEEYFAPEMTYYQKFGFQDEDALWFIRQKPPWTDLEVETAIIDSETVEILGVGTDPVTGLRHTIHWQLIVKHDKITCVIERGSRGR